MRYGVSATLARPPFPNVSAQLIRVRPFRARFLRQITSAGGAETAGSQENKTSVRNTAPGRNNIAARNKYREDTHNLPGADLARAGSCRNKPVAECDLRDRTIGPSQIG